jgi:hypothetical protein
MPTHTCACHYGPDGRCIWCHNGVPDKVPHVPGVETLPPPTSLGQSSKPQYIPFSSWGRQNARRSFTEALGREFVSMLAPEAEDDPLTVLLKLASERRGLDKLIGAGMKESSGPRPVMRKGHL